MWWLIVWRAAVGGMILAGIAGFIWGLITVLAGWPDSTVVGAVILGYAIAFAWGLYVVRMALRKRYRSFRIALVRS